MRLILRVSVVVFLALGALIYNAGDIVDPWQPWSSFGFSADSSGTIATVDQYAQARGLSVGDAVDLSRMSFNDRLQLGPARSARSGHAIVLPLRSGKSVRLVAHPRPRTFLENITDVAAVLALITYTLIAAAVVLLRPMQATWAFLIFSAAFLYNGNQDLQYFPSWLDVLLSYVMQPLLQALGPIAFISFALRFPNAVPAAQARTLERIAWFAVAPILIALNLRSEAFLLAVAYPPTVTNWVQWAIVALYVPGILTLVARYTRSAQDERTRLRWVVATFAIAVLPYVIFTAAQTVFANVISLSIANLVQTGLIIAPVALAYTILKHRLFDVRFVVSRTLILGVMTTLTIGILALADWGFGKWLEQSRFQLIAEVLLALAIGFSMTTLHKRIERFLNRVIFHAQALALAAIRCFTLEVDLIGDPKLLLMQTLETLRSRLDAQYVAIFTADGATFVQSAPVVEGFPTLLSASDLTVLRLRRWTEPFECDVPKHPLHAALMLPMTSRTDLIGFIACGPKPDHTHYIPEEIDTLQALAHRAGAGYAWLTMRSPSSLPILHAIAESQ